MYCIVDISLCTDSAVSSEKVVSNISDCEIRAGVSLLLVLVSLIIWDQA